MNDVANIAGIIAPVVLREGVAFLPGNRLRWLPSWTGLDSFIAAWDNLGADAYLPGGSTYRSRRYGRLLAKPMLGGNYILSPMRFAPFQQSADLIPLYEGRPRMFMSIEDDALVSPFLASLINLDLAIVASTERPRKEYIVGLHMIRVVVRPGLKVLPAPEGRHADGHRYVAMHLIKKHGCVGGESRVFLPGRSEPILETTLTESLDTLIVDDRRVEHAVTAVRAMDCDGKRDMLLVDFDLA